MKQTSFTTWIHAYTKLHLYSTTIIWNYFAVMTVLFQGSHLFQQHLWRFCSWPSVSPPCKNTRDKRTEDKSLPAWSGQSLTHKHSTHSDSSSSSLSPVTSHTPAHSAMPSLIGQWEELLTLWHWPAVFFLPFIYWTLLREPRRAAANQNTSFST